METRYISSILLYELLMGLTDMSEGRCCVLNERNLLKGWLVDCMLVRSVVPLIFFVRFEIGEII